MATLIRQTGWHIKAQPVSSSVGWMIRGGNPYVATAWQIKRSIEISSSWVILASNQMVGKVGWAVRAEVSDQQVGWKILNPMTSRTFWRIKKALGPSDTGWAIFSNHYDLVSEVGWRIHRTQETPVSWEVKQSLPASIAWQLKKSLVLQSGWRIKTVVGLSTGLDSDTELSSWTVLSDTSAFTGWRIHKYFLADVSWRIATETSTDTAWNVCRALDPAETSWAILLPPGITGQIIHFSGWMIRTRVKISTPLDLDTQLEDTTYLDEFEDIPTAWSIRSRLQAETAWKFELKTMVADCSWTIRRPVVSGTWWGIHKAFTNQTSWAVGSIGVTHAQTAWGIKVQEPHGSAWRIKTSSPARTGWVIYKNTSFYPIRMFVVPERDRVSKVPHRDRVLVVPKRIRFF